MIGDYILKNSRNPHKMLKNSSKILQSDAYASQKDFQNRISEAILTIASIIQNVEKAENISNNHLQIATNILLKRSYSVIRDDDFDDLSSISSDDSEGEPKSDEEPSEEEEGGEQDEESLYGDSPKRGQKQYDEDKLNDLVQDVIKYDLPEEIKKGRINFFQQSNFK
jgi:hypothetical protein